jgi:hypothetical protein
MRKAIIIAAAFAIASCGYTPEEQMLVDYEDNVVEEALNTTVDELSFELTKVEPKDDLLSSDSARYYISPVAKTWCGDKIDYSNEAMDTTQTAAVIVASGSVKRAK